MERFPSIRYEDVTRRQRCRTNQTVYFYTILRRNIHSTGIGYNRYELDQNLFPIISDRLHHIEDQPLSQYLSQAMEIQQHVIDITIEN